MIKRKIKTKALALMLAGATVLGTVTTNVDTTAASGTWKSDAAGWWYDEDGYYPTNRWLNIDGYDYYFTADGYMDYSEYRDGYWLGSSGAWDTSTSYAEWKNDSTGWWYQAESGWYPVSEWLWINGY